MMPTSHTPRHRRFIALSGVLVIGGAILLGVVGIILDYGKTIEAAYQRLENLARIADENISGRLVAVDLMLQDVAREYQDIKKPEDETALRAFMKARTASLEGVRTVSITDAKGTVVESTLPAIKGFDGSQRAYFTKPLETQEWNRLFLNGPILSTTGSTVVFASRALPAVNGNWAGVILSSLPPDLFIGVLESIRPNDGFATLVGIDGTIMARSPDQEKYVGKSVAKGPAFSAHTASGGRISHMTTLTVTEGREMLVVSRTARFSELVVTVGHSKDDVLAAWRVKSIIIGIIILLLAILGAAVLRLSIRHERELLDQRNFARQLVETANVLVMGTNPNGEIRLFNAAAETVSGFDRAEVKGRSWLDMLDTDDGLEVMRESFRNGHPQSGEFVAPLRTKDGQERVIAWRNSVVTGNPDIVFMAFGVDITDRLQAERNLQTSQRFLMAITDNIPGMIGYWDAGMRCRFANKAYLEWFGRSPQDLLGHSMLDLMGEKLFALNEHYIRGALRGEPQTFERTLTKADGSTGYTWAHYIPDTAADGAVLGFFVLVNDITPLKKTEIRLREVSERLALAAKAGGIGIWSWDVTTQQLIWDDRMYEMYGLDPKIPDSVYEMWRQACHPADVERAEAELAAALSGEAAFDTEFRILTPDGQLRHIKAAAALECNESGHPIRMIGVNWDITPLREGEIALKVAQHKAETASRAKSEFLANMSHEIRTPMNAILGLAHLLERTDLPPDQRTMATKIGVAGRSLLSIINDILDFSKVEAGRLELDVTEFQLSDLLDALSTIMSVNASTKDLELVIGMPKDTPKALMGDPLRLQQVLINLISNAIKFTERGDVSLRVEQTATCDDGKVELRFTVKDTGIGIAPDVIPKLFDAFTQADTSTTRRFGGSGLGLAICKRLVELMGGRIGVESWPGQGSTFWFTAPFVVTATSAEDRDCERVHDLDVLIADDHDVARESIAQTASALGWATEAVASGKQALERAQVRLDEHSPFDILILDWKMPGMDGLAVSQAVRGITGLDQSPIVIMVTAYSREDLLHAPGAKSIDAVLVKPVTASSLFNAVMDARARRSGSDAIVAAIAPATGGQRLANVRLLLVEDNSINQDVAKRVLELEGATVAVVGDGQQAVDVLATSPTAFDAVLMDIQMPVMDGYQSTTRIRHDLGLSQLPIIALTAGALETERNRAHQAGMNDFIAKPFDVDKMVLCIRRHVTVAEAIAPLALPTRDEALEVSIPGIDMRQAALRLGGDNALFASLLRRVRDDFTDTPSRVRDHLAAKDSESAARLLHTLRGATGNVAATTVAALASRTEAAIKDAQASETIENLLNRLDDALAALCQAIAASGILAAEENSPAPKGMSTVSRDEIEALIEALTSRSMAAFDLFATMRASLSSVLDPATVESIAGDVDSLQFEAAAGKLKTAASRG
jgi:two-component system, sensor histidine kinase and response regulator